MFEIMVEDTFSSAHQLIGYEGPCENLHGHTWKVQVFYKGSRLGKLGMLFDFKKARMILKEVIFGFDHHNLNELKAFKSINPTAENIAKVIFDEVKKKIKKEIRLEKVTVWESEETCATYSL